MNKTIKPIKYIERLWSTPSKDLSKLDRIMVWFTLPILFIFALGIILNLFFILFIFTLGIILHLFFSILPGTGTYEDLIYKTTTKRK